jgi:putative acetyltransferase
VKLRTFQPTDRDGIIALIDGVYREYGDRIFLENADADLLDVQKNYVAAGGAFIVLVDDDGAVRGTHAIMPLADQPGVCTLRRIYLDPALRGSGWADRLMDWALEEARQRGFRRIEFWSDTRFTRGHRFFARYGFNHDGQIRELNDGWMPYREKFFFRDLA